MRDVPEIVMKAYFASPQALESFVLHGLPELPKKIRPTHFGEHERERKTRKNAIDNVAAYRGFLEKRQGGGFRMYGRRCTFDVSPCERRPSEFFFLVRPKHFSASLGVSLMEVSARYGAIYGFGAHWDEYRERNGFRIPFTDGGTSSGFLGRDFRPYVPGLYWLNYFSDRYRREKEINASALADRIGGTVSSVPEGTILQLYEEPDDWPEHNDRVCSVIDETPNVFSKRDVDFPSNLTMYEYIHNDADAFTDAWPW